MLKYVQIHAAIMCLVPGERLCKLRYLLYYDTRKCLYPDNVTKINTSCPQDRNSGLGGKVVAEFFTGTNYANI